MPWRHAPLAYLAGLLAILSAPPALAQESAPFTSPQTTVTVVSEAQAIAPGQPFRLGLRQRIASGWHTYWSNPGDAGEPPQLTLGLPEGAKAGELVFPAPERIPYGPLVNFGYENEVVFPISVTPPATLVPGQTFSVKADGYWLVCAEICIPEEASFTLDLPIEATPRLSPDTAPMFAAAEAALPRPSPWPATAGFAGEAGALQLAGDTFSPASVEEAFFFPAEWGVVENAAPQELTVGPGTLTLSLARAKGELPERLDGVIAITDQAGSRSTYTVSAPLGPVPAAASPALGLWQAALFALAGGLLLNLMPCVFPILAMKAVGIAGLSGAERRTIRGHAVSYTGGVVLSFLALGGLLLALKAGGMVAGWGFQFTSPIFVAAMSWLMLAVGLNLSGVYAVGGPASSGSGLAAKGGHAGSFATGALAVLVATPCTAPFMAAAIGAAFAMPPAATLAVFLAMGIGMALPYALLALFPHLARLLPRPGSWMERLKQFLAFPMYGAAIWLVWVLTMQTGADGVLLALGGGLLIAFAAWAIGAAQAGSGRTGLLAKAAAGLAVLGALALLPQLQGATAAPRIPVAGAAEPWSAARVSELQAKGQPVFVNMTAAWCITCKVNERIALDTDAVQAAFRAGNVALLEGDWTNGDPAISALLKSQGREGVPLYLLYSASGGTPTVLPQILTENIVLQAIEATTRTAARVPGQRSS
ncbi:MAG TPA: protein-disulfide reductase DsbD domain-containing protein [Geminicoccus sp.]|jgi:thiol:disulfide interchange protein DsbD|uniref:protein-disulfide reductase DsbD family protein n=1 Tax=Geminicoccus sp. TaxID=2024832 RepID=UPI002E2F5A1E|nr:protein-disulfide reductase DsbD domain-containing protein [Geminicoccus sp.]HEX2528970.1 protein-disulfide reductase DsbD domain-containing protein [Geminicoccus sp.]